MGLAGTGAITNKLQLVRTPGAIFGFSALKVLFINMSPHPKGSRARILLSSVFGPYAQDDAFGSRKINPMELYHNQVTREQGAFSLRMFHRSWGILMIQENISAPTTVLDFPTREAFEAELTGARLRHRRHLVHHRERGQGAGDVPDGAAPLAALDHRGGRARGGHSGDRKDDRRRPHRARRRHFLDAAFSGRRRKRAHPPSRHRLRLRRRAPWACRCRRPAGSTAATIIPSVGCPMGCNFCTTSAFFGGKGQYLNFYDTGEELFGVMARDGSASWACSRSS